MVEIYYKNGKKHKN